MGIKGLWKELEGCTTKAHISNYKGWTFGVDAFGWLHRAALPSAAKLAQGIPCDKYLAFFTSRLDLLRHFGVKAVLVFDGRSIPAKGDTNRERREKRDKARAEGLALLRLGGDPDRAAKLLESAVEVPPEMALSAVRLAKERGFQCIIAPYEADAQLAFMCREHYIYGVISEDCDLMVYGCSMLLAKLTSSGHCDCVKFADVLRLKSFAGLDQSLFTIICVLSGCDYSGSLPGVGIKRAIKVVQKARHLGGALKALRDMFQAQAVMMGGDKESVSSGGTSSNSSNVNGASDRQEQRHQYSSGMFSNTVLTVVSDDTAPDKNSSGSGIGGNNSNNGGGGGGGVAPPTAAYVATNVLLDFENYEERVNKAFYAFQHHLIYHPGERKIVPVTPFLSENGHVPEIVGDIMSDGMARNVCENHTHNPKTMLPYGHEDAAAAIGGGDSGGDSKRSNSSSNLLKKEDNSNVSNVSAGKNSSSSISSVENKNRARLNLYNACLDMYWKRVRGANQPAITQFCKPMLSSSLSFSSSSAQTAQQAPSTAAATRSQQEEQHRGGGAIVMIPRARDRLAATAVAGVPPGAAAIGHQRPVTKIPVASKYFNRRGENGVYKTEGAPIVGMVIRPPPGTAAAAGAGAGAAAAAAAGDVTPLSSSSSASPLVTLPSSIMSVVVFDPPQQQQQRVKEDDSSNANSSINNNINNNNNNDRNMVLAAASTSSGSPSLPRENSHSQSMQLANKSKSSQQSANSQKQQQHRRREKKEQLVSIFEELAYNVTVSPKRRPRPGDDGEDEDDEEDGTLRKNQKNNNNNDNNDNNNKKRHEKRGDDTAKNDDDDDDDNNDESSVIIEEMLTQGPKEERFGDDSSDDDDDNDDDDDDDGDDDAARDAERIVAAASRRNLGAASIVLKQMNPFVPISAVKRTAAVAVVTSAPSSSSSASSSSSNNSNKNGARSSNNGNENVAPQQNSAPPPHLPPAKTQRSHAPQQQASQFSSLPGVGVTGGKTCMFGGTFGALAFAPPRRCGLSRPPTPSPVAPAPAPVASTSAAASTQRQQQQQQQQQQTKNSTNNPFNAVMEKFANASSSSSGSSAAMSKRK